MAILTSDYNAIQSRISRILGVGENEFGYGQTLVSFELATTVPALTPDFTRLRTDILAARYHQIGVPNTPPISVISSTITAAQWRQFLTVMTQVETSKLVSPHSSQATRVELANEVTPGNTWNNTTTHTVTVQFDNAEHMRHYFNTGSTIEFSATSVNTGTNSKSVAWNSLLTGVGVVSFKHSATTSTKTSGSLFGFTSLTEEDQVIFKKTKADTPAASIYQISARQEIDGESGEPSGVIIFTIRYINSGSNATATLRSIVNAYHASGVYVDIEPPVPSSVFEPGDPNPTFTLSRSLASINETNLNVTFTVTTTNFSDGLLYFTVSGTKISASDFDVASDLVSGTLRGSVDIVNNTGSFVLIPAADLFTEGKEQFQVQLRYDEIITSPVLAQLTSLEIITDTSLTPPTPVYTILPLSTTSVTEGQTVLYRIVTKNVKDGTDLYWNTKVLTPSLLASDFVDNRLNGVVTVYGNQTELYRTIYEDTLSETTAESYQIVLSVLDATTGLSRTVQTSELVKISDKVSVEPIVPYVVLVDDNSIPEDSTTKVTFTIKTPKLPLNTKLYWRTVKDIGVLAAQDFTDNTLTGSVVISNNVGIVTRRAKKDALTEGNETFHLSVFSDVGMTNWLVDSDPVTIEETVSYALTRTPATMEESTTGGALGAGVTFNLTTPWLPNGTVLYWTTVSDQGVVEAADFTDNAMDGFVTITENYKGIILRRAAKDSFVEGTEQFHLEIRATEGTVGPILVSSQLTSITETVPYEIIPLNSYMVEDEPGVEFVVKTPFLKPGTVLFWETSTVTGSVTASDFEDNRSSGTVEINGNQGSIIREAKLDSLTEGKESFRLILKTGSSISTKVATSSVVTLGETVAYTISLTNPSFTEGLAPITVSFTTPAVLDGTKVYWTILKHAGNITADDFIVSDAQGGSGQRLDGYALTLKNKGSFIISARRDTITEEPETFQIELRIDSIVGAVQVTSPLITLNEIIPYTIVPSATLVNEGETVKFTVSTPWIADTEKRQLNWTTYSTLGTINTTDHPDFTDSIDGSVIVNGNSAQIFRTVSKDTFTELGVKNFGIKVWTTTGTLLATSTVVTMNDTSQTVAVPDPADPIYSIVPRKSKIIEGESVIFDIITENVLPATPLYWTTFRSANLLDGQLLQTQGSAPIYIAYDEPGTANTAGHATITVTATTNNNKIEADRMFLLELRTGSINGPVVQTSSMPVALVDATPFLIRANNSSITEGNPAGVRFDISTPESAYGTTMTYTIVPQPGSTITSDDFVGLSSLTNTVTIDQYGAGNFTLYAAANQPKELDESFSIQLVPQGSSIPVTLGAPSPVVKITETAVYTLTSTTTNNSVIEGSAATFTFSTPKLPADTSYSYRIIGVGERGSSLDGSDFSPAGLTGKFTVTSAASSYSLSILTTAGGTEGSEQFQLEISLESTGQLVVLTGGSPTITITKNTPYTIKPRSGSVQEGNKIIFDVTSPLLTPNSSLLCVIKPTTVGSFTGSDLDIGTLSPRAILSDGSNGTLEFVPMNDGTVKGNRPFTVWLYDINEGNYVVSSSVTITDAASQTIPQPNNSTWRLNPTLKTVIQTNSIVFKLTTSAASTSDRVITWSIQILEQLDTLNPNSNPFTGATGQVTLAANTATVNITIPTIVSPGIVRIKLSLTINNAPIEFTDDLGFNNTGIYSSTAFSGYAAEVVVVEKKTISIVLSKNQLINKTTDSLEVTITAPWYMTGYKVTVQVAANSYWNPNGMTPEFLPVTQDVLVISGFTPGMVANKLYSFTSTGKCTISLNPASINNNLTGQAFNVTATNGNDNIFTAATPQPFNVIAKPSYSITSDKPSIDETPTNNTVRFTVTTPASATDITLLYWKVVGVDYKLLGLTSASGYIAKDSDNSTWIEFTAIADQTTNTGVREFYIEVRSTPTGAELPFQIPCPKVKINDTSKNLVRTITITDYLNNTTGGRTGITMPVSASANPDMSTGYLKITASVSPAFANQTFDCEIVNATHTSIPAALHNGTIYLTARAITTTDNNSVLRFELTSKYRQDIPVSGSFQVRITSQTEPSCTTVSKTLEFLVPNTPAPPVVYSPTMTLVKSTVDANESSVLTISGGKPGDTGIVKAIGAQWAAGLDFTIIGRSITLGAEGTPQAGIYTAQVGTWKTGGPTTFTATFAVSKPCSAILTVNEPPPSPVTGEITYFDKTYQAGVSTKDYGDVICKFLNAKEPKSIIVSIHSTNPNVQLIRQAFNADPVTGVLPGSYPTPSNYVVSVRLNARQITGLPLSSTFTVRFTSPYLNGNTPVVVESGDITLIGQAVYTNTLNLEASTNTSGLGLRILFTGKPGSKVVISCERVVTVANNSAVFNGNLDASGNGVIVYDVENTAYPAPSPFRTMSLGAKGNITATFADGAKITKGFAIKGAFQGTVTPPAGVFVRGVAVGGGGGGGASMEIGGWAGSSGGGGGAGGISTTHFVANGTSVTLVSGNGGLGGVDTLTKVSSSLWVSVAPTDGGTSSITYQGTSNIYAYGGKAGGRGIAMPGTPTVLPPQGGAGGNGTTSNGGAGGNGMFDNKSGSSTNVGAPGGVNTDGVGGNGAGGASPTISEAGTQSSWAKKPGFPGNDGRAMISWIDLSNTAPIVADPPVTSPPAPSIPATTTVDYPKFNSRTISTTEVSRGGMCYWEQVGIVVGIGHKFLISCDDSGSVKLYNESGQIILDKTAVYNWSTFAIPDWELIEKIEITYQDGSNPSGRGILASIKDSLGTVIWDQSYTATHYV